MEEIVIHILDVNVIKEKYFDFYNCLTSNQQKKVSQFKNERLMLSNLGGYYFINKYTNKKSLRYNKYGKPQKAGENFNVSHSGDYVVFAKAPCSIGIDIEKVRIYNSKLLDYVCNDQDKKQVKTLEDFFIMWTQKESLIKCIGTGLAKGDIKEVPAYPITERMYNTNKYYSSVVDYKDYIISVTTTEQSNILEVKEELI